MSESGIKHKFLTERKKTVKQEVVKVQTEYTGILQYLDGLVDQVEEASSDLLAEDHYDTFVKKFGPSMNTIQDILGKLILLRLSLPGQAENSDGSDYELAMAASAVSVKTPPRQQNSQQWQSTRTMSPMSNNSYMPPPSPPLVSVPPVEHIPPMIHEQPSIGIQQTASSVCPAMVSTGPLVSTDALPEFGASAVTTAANVALELESTAWLSFARLPKFEIRDPTLYVTVVTVTNPWMFWVQVHTKTQDFEDLIEKLEVFHSRFKGSDSRYKLDRSQIRVGALISAVFTDMKWYRARIVAVYSKSVSTVLSTVDVELFYIDYGNYERVPVDRLRPLPQEFLTWPSQVFPCSLNKIEPFNGTDDWQQEISIEFHDLVRSGNDLVEGTKRYIRIEDACDYPVVFVDIFSDENSAKMQSGTPASQTLVERGMVRRVRSNLPIIDWYLKNCTYAIRPDGFDSMRWIDLHNTHMPRLHEALSGNAGATQTRPGAGSGSSGPRPNADGGGASQPATGSGAALQPNGINHVTGKPAGDGNDFNVYRAKLSGYTNAPVVNSMLLPAKVDPLCTEMDVTKLDRITEWVNQQATQSAIASKPCPTKVKASPNKARGSVSAAVDAKGVRLGESYSRTKLDFFDEPERDSVRPVVDAAANGGPDDHSEGWKVVHGGKSEKKWKPQQRHRQDIPTTGVAGLYGRPPLSEKEMKNRFQIGSKMLADLSEGNSVRSSSTSEQLSPNSASQAVVGVSGTKSQATGNLVTPDLKIPDWLHSKAPGDVRERDRHGSFNSRIETPRTYPLSGDVTPLFTLGDDSIKPMSKPRVSSCPRTQSSSAADESKISPPKTHHTSSLNPLATSFSYSIVEDKSAPDPGCSTPNTLEALPTCELEVDAKRSKPSTPSTSTLFASACTSLSTTPRKEERRRSPDVEESTAAPDVPAADNLSRSGLPPLLLPVPDGHCIAVAMSCPESPSRFWVHSIDAAKLDFVQDKLLEYSATLTNRNYLTDFSPHSVICAYSVNYEGYYRAKILKVCHGDAICRRGTKDCAVSICTCDQEKNHGRQSAVLAVRLLYVDFGGTEWTNLSRLWPLPEELKVVPPLAICCHLDDLEPAVVTSKANDVRNKIPAVDWTPEAKKCFIDLVGGVQPDVPKLLWAHVGKDLVPGVFISPSLWKPMSVKLVDGTKNVGDELVAAGHASHIAGNCHWTCFNPMAEDYLSERNSYQVDVDDPGVATVGYQAKDEQRVCRFFNTRSGCWRGDLCSYEHIRNRDVTGVTSDRQPVACAFDSEMELVLPEAGNWIPVEVTHIFSPNHICVCFPYGPASLEELRKQPDADMSQEIEQFHEDLNAHYMRKVLPDSDLTLYGIGELVVARFTANERWHRAKILGRDDCNSFKVLYIDYGNTEWIGTDRIRQMELQFMHMPFQAVGCYLPLQPSLPDGQWANEARALLESLVIGKVLHALIRSTSHQTIQADLYYDNLSVAEEMAKAGLAVMSLAKFPKSLHRSAGDGSSFDEEKPVFTPG